MLTYRLNHILFGSEPWSFHFVNVLLNCFVSYLVFQLYVTITKLCFNQNLRESGKGKLRPLTVTGVTSKNHDVTKDAIYISTVATLLFIVHPIHTETVSCCANNVVQTWALFIICVD